MVGLFHIACPSASLGNSPSSSGLNGFLQIGRGQERELLVEIKVADGKTLHLRGLDLVHANSSLGKLEPRVLQAHGSVEVTLGTSPMEDDAGVDVCELALIV